jgi:hypothetical protein
MEPELGTNQRQFASPSARNRHASQSMGLFGTGVSIRETQPTHIAKSRTTLPMGYNILHASVMIVIFIDRINLCRPD